MLVEKYNNLNKENSNSILDKYFKTKTLQRLKGKGLFCGMDYVEISEKEIISKILDSKYGDVLKDVLSLKEVSYATNKDNGLVIISKPKIRQANPLCVGQMEVCEIDGITGTFYRELNNLSEAIELTDKPIVGNLEKNTVKILSKYKKI